MSCKTSKAFFFPSNCSHIFLAFVVMSLKIECDADVFMCSGPAHGGMGVLG